MPGPAFLRPALGAIALTVLSAASATAQGPLLSTESMGSADRPAVLEGRAAGHVTVGARDDAGRLVDAPPGGPALPASIRAERAVPTGLADRLGLDYGTGLRRTLLMGLTGAAAGAVAGMAMEVVDPHGEIADVWPVLLAIPGFFGGVVYSLVR